VGLKSGGGQFRVLGHHDNAYIRSKLLDLGRNGRAFPAGQTKQGYRAENCKAFHGSCLDLRLGSMEESNCVFLTSWTVLFARCASASRSGARTLPSNSEQISTRVEGTFINFMRRSS